MNSESNRESKVARTTTTTDATSDCSDSSIQSGDVDSRNIRKTYGNPVIMQPIQSDKNIPVRTLESLMWLRNTYHRDMVDQLMYKTTRVYTTRYLKEDFIVVDRVLMLANNKYTDKGDTKCIHAGGVEKYSIRVVNQSSQPA